MNLFIVIHFGKSYKTTICIKNQSLFVKKSVIVNNNTIGFELSLN